MKLAKIYTRRGKRKENYAQPIIYEWEDVISDELEIPIARKSFFYKVINKLKIHSAILGPSKATFRFVINGRDYDEPMNSKHVVPCIIDFFEKDNQLQEFYRKHSKNKIILFSSPFDYVYLKKKKSPLNIGLMAYSLPDKYAFEPKRKVEKKYDIVLTGRQDPLLFSFFKEYIKRHPKVSYVKRGVGIENDSSKTKDYYLNGKECLGAIESRKDFMKLQSQGRATLYGLQGYIDGFSKGFYHMTPHFLEIIACGCHVLCRYPVGEDGIDAAFFEMDRFSQSIETYDEFEVAMDKALSTEIDVEMYSTYLKKHYTSARIEELKGLLKDL